MAWAGAAFGAEQEVGEDELRGRISAVEGELKRLREGEGAPAAYRELRDISKTQRELRRRHKKELQEPQERMNELHQQEAVQEWQKRIEEKWGEHRRLRRELADVW